MTRVALAVREERDAIVVLAGRATFPPGAATLAYGSRTGALVRIDGAIAGAFDARHDAIDVHTAGGEHEITVEVERRSLPTDGLPAGDGLRWRLMVARSHPSPSRTLTISARAAGGHVPGSDGPDVPFLGHSHLDVAWLWTYEATRRKAVRTFSTALRQIDRDARYVYAQSQPQLYAWVLRDAPELLERVRAQLGRGWDASVAALWVEPDLHAPSGESILRQFAYAAAWCEQHLGTRPSVAWLPDTFGFPSTFPTLARHAGVPFFATTKLQWNDTTRWPYPQFDWHGDDGAVLRSAVIDAYGGPPSGKRIATARKRAEPLVHGFGDGGGGPADHEIFAQPGAQPWTALGGWFAAGAARAVPSYRGELYLETHRGTYTTHRALKARLAALERDLATAEEAAAWVVAVRAPLTVRRSLVDDLRSAWEPVLRAQFHDVAAGTSVTEAYALVDTELTRAARIAGRVLESATSILPKASLAFEDPAAVEPERDGTNAWRISNGIVRARVRADGTVDELATADGRSVVALANGLALFRDRPKAWDAWNLDRSYVKHPLRVRPAGGSVDDGGIVARFAVGRTSKLTLRVALHDGEPWLRVNAAVSWHEDHAILRVEHRLALATTDVRYGQPHGTLVRTARPTTPQERARYEVPAQRYAHAAAGDDGVAIFARDVYGWNAAALRGGGVRVGMSLLRAPRWPDPTADRGDHDIAWALAPTQGATIGGLEAAYDAYAGEERVRLFSTDDPGITIVATYPAPDGERVIVRVRECDGIARTVTLRCGARMRTVQPVDACERPIEATATIAEEAIRFDLGAYTLATFSVGF